MEANPSFVPSMMSHVGSKMSFFDRVWNMMAKIISKSFMYYHTSIIGMNSLEQNMQLNCTKIIVVVNFFTCRLNSEEIIARRAFCNTTIVQPEWSHDQHRFHPRLLQTTTAKLHQCWRHPDQQDQTSTYPKRHAQIHWRSWPRSCPLHHGIHLQCQSSSSQLHWQAYVSV